MFTITSWQLPQVPDQGMPTKIRYDKMLSTIILSLRKAQARVKCLHQYANPFQAPGVHQRSAIQALLCYNASVF